MRITDCTMREMQPSLAVEFLTKISFKFCIEFDHNYYVKVEGNNPAPRKKDENPSETYNLEAKIYDVTLSVQDLTLDQLKARIDTLSTFNIGVEGEADDPQELPAAEPQIVQQQVVAQQPVRKYRSTIS